MCIRDRDKSKYVPPLDAPFAVRARYFKVHSGWAAPTVANAPVSDTAPSRYLAAIAPVVSVLGGPMGDPQEAHSIMERRAAENAVQAAFATQLAGAGHVHVALRFL